MKYTNSLRKGISFLILLSISTFYLQSQTLCVSDCQVQCQGQVNVSLDQTCMALITPAMGGVGITPDCNDYYSLKLWDSYDHLIYGNKVDISHDGQLLKYEITEPECGNKCWGHILAEYKLPPFIECPPDDTLTCGALAVLDLPPATGGCADFEVSLLSEIRSAFLCDPLYTQTVTRTYIAKDQLGNQSECTHTILLKRIDFGSIIFPEILTVGNGTAISCKDDIIEFDANGIPLPWPSDPSTGSGSGVPILCDPNVINGLFCPLTGSGNGVPLLPYPFIGSQTNIPTGVACNAAVIYTDLELPKIGCIRKIMRTWEVREWWCNGENVAGAVQLIEIVDDQAPEFYCPIDFTVSTGYDCAGHVNMPDVVATDECGTVIKYAIEYPNGRLETNGGFIDLSLGHNNVKYIVSDDCYNSSYCYVNVTVEDNTNPVAICEQYKVVSLSQSGNTIVFAEPFDNGSWDECGLDRFEVRRMDTICVAADTLFDDRITFCCVDAGTEVMVVFRAWDRAQNYNDCMVTVEIQDKAVPNLTCPPDVTIDCRDGYDLNNLSITFGDLSVSDNCAEDNIEETVIPDVNQCGVGTIVRLFELRDGNGNELRHCKQIITITNNTPFVGANIIWPPHYELTGGCDLADLSPENLPEPYGFPTFVGGDDECSLLGYDYDDSVFQAIPNSGECAHIERRWSVINWCSQINGEFEIWHNPFPQIIKLNNTISPEIDDQEDIVFESQSIDCINSNVIVERTATDDCANALFWTFTIRNSNDVLIGTGNSNTIVDTLPTGIYNIEWTVHDGCANFDIDFQQIEVINIKSPSPVCIHGLSANLVLMDLDNNGEYDAEMVELWASDFDAKSYHNCGNPIVLSLDRDTTIKSRIYDCDDIGINVVQLWVTDAVTGVADYCETFVDIQDNNGDNFCEPEDMNRVVISGDIYTEINDEVEGVEVEVGIPDLYEMTDELGSYAFGPMPMGGSYKVVPTKDKDYLNGISTLDLIIIQRHILGAAYLDSPYKMIAADINGNDDISAVDLIELRKLILGVYDELPNNTSWRFIDSDFSFIDPFDPWFSQFPEDYDIFSLDSDMDIDFVGVKIGDVNGSVVANAQSNVIEQRNDNPLVLEIERKSLSPGERGTIKVYSDNYSNQLGWQTTIEYSSEELEILNISGVGLEKLNHDNYNISNDNGWLSISYHSITGEHVNSETPLFEISVIAKKDINTGSLFSLSSDVAKSESYGASQSIQGIELNNHSYVEGATRINSVNPNPWIEKANIQFDISFSGQVVWKFYDINGRLLFQDNRQYEQGAHSYEINKSRIDATGVIYIQLITERDIAEYKMLIL